MWPGFDQLGASFHRLWAAVPQTWRTISGMASVKSGRVSTDFDGFRPIQGWSRPISGHFHQVCAMFDQAWTVFDNNWAFRALGGSALMVWPSIQTDGSSSGLVRRGAQERRRLDDPSSRHCEWRKERRSGPKHPLKGRRGPPGPRFFRILHIKLCMFATCSPNSERGAALWTHKHAARSEVNENWPNMHALMWEI